MAVLVGWFVRSSVRWFGGWHGTGLRLILRNLEEASWGGLGFLHERTPRKLQPRGRFLGTYIGIFVVNLVRTVSCSVRKDVGSARTYLP